MSDRSRCEACGAELGPGANFCRACGAAVEATEVAAAPDAPPASVGATSSPDAPPPEWRACPSCGAAIVAGARFCHSCGGPAAGRDPTLPSGPRGPRGPVLALAAFAVCMVVGGAIAGGVYLLNREEPNETSIVDRPIGDDGSRGDGGFGGATTVDEGDDDPDEPVLGPSPLVPGRYVQAGSFRSPEGAQREVDRLLGEGIEVFAIPADTASELLPGFQVLLVGPLATSGEEQQALRRLEEASVSGFGRDLTPSEAIPGPQAAAGAWSGELELSYLRGERGPSGYPVAFELGSDGVSGTVDHLGRGCTGTLSLVEETGYSLSYAETIESGPCPAGGVWHLRPEGGRVTVVWLHDDLQAMVDGTASAAG